MAVRDAPCNPANDVCHPTCAFTECGPSISTLLVLKNGDIQTYENLVLLWFLFISIRVSSGKFSLKLMKPRKRSQLSLSCAAKTGAKIALKDPKSH